LGKTKKLGTRHTSAGGAKISNLIQRRVKKINEAIPREKALGGTKKGVKFSESDCADMD